MQVRELRGTAEHWNISHRVAEERRDKATRELQSNSVLEVAENMVLQCDRLNKNQSFRSLEGDSCKESSRCVGEF